jgi:hypothetical protein
VWVSTIQLFLLSTVLYNTPINYYGYYKTPGTRVAQAKAKYPNLERGEGGVAGETRASPPLLMVSANKKAMTL